ncbi:hypothetical protein Tel_05460 [Candidatus Tenderia electrophaga]|jgi:flagellar L-ring protein precursor FlgH|uniref:Flagellar L-ring protein n=1 Tax=Candidatus Tenderia electrophaga TaxID=1748243 RepID=A0A0S2TI90_9GAMM|nr:hypothetical protein Tel_05460 [Candidatus Tenderia electrophaga]
MLSLTLLSLLAAGCSTAPAKLAAEGFETVRPPYVSPPPPQQGAIFQAGYGISLYEDMRARRVGDVITIVLTERTNASKQASTSTSKDTSIEVENPTLFGRELRFDLPRPFNSSKQNATLATSVDSSNAFDGEGDSAQSNSLTGNITVTVAEVLPNGNLIVQGQKRVTINQGDEVVRFSGIVRPQDISPDNTVVSTKVANARIAYVGEGMLADANSQGWLGRFFNSKWWPF